MFAPTETPEPDCPACVTLVRLDPAELTLTSALRHLRAEHGVRALLCEGGPTLMGALLHERLVDELFLTLAPQLAGGGTGPTMSERSRRSPSRPRWSSCGRSSGPARCTCATRCGAS